LATILETAKVHQEEDVIWVSNDRDFWDDTDTGFHEHLVEDVASMEASGRVRPVKELWDVVLELAAQHSSDAGDMEALRNELQEQTVLKYLEKFLSDNAEQFHLDAREAALPVETEDAAIRSIHDLEDLIYEVKGGVASGEAVAGFTIKGQVDMTLRLPIEATGTYSPDEIVSTSDDSATILTRKPLIFRGVLQLGRYDGPLGVEITGIDAEPNDPGFALWRLMERQQYRHLAIMKRIFENPSMTRNFVPSAEAVRKNGGGVGRRLTIRGDSENFREPKHDEELRAVGGSRAKNGGGVGRGLTIRGNSENFREPKRDQRPRLAGGSDAKNGGAVERGPDF
jgi:hypothetical protein